MKKKMTLKEWMQKPYTKGDYYGSIAVILGLYGLAIGGYLLYDKLTDHEAVTLGKELASNLTSKKEVCTEETEEDEA